MLLSHPLGLLPPPAIDINGEFKFYIVEAIEINTGQFMIYYALEDHLIIGAVHPGYSYRCRVALVNIIDRGPFTDYFVVTAASLGIASCV